PFPVTYDPSTDWGPVWSPDGQFIYFSSDRGGVMNLWRIRVQEETGKVLGDPQPVTTGVVASVEHASFSVDSKKILYSAVVRSSNLQKLRFDPDRETVVGSPTWVTQGSAPLDWPAVSPDEQSIAYTTSRQQEDLYIIRADGTGRRQLTFDSFKDQGHEPSATIATHDPRSASVLAPV